MINLLKTTEDDLNSLFEFQLDEEARHLAAFMSKDACDKTAYLQKYSQFLTDPTINMCSIIFNGALVGSISKFVLENDVEITYWIDRKFWGQGIATNALKQFLEIEHSRPIRGRVAFDNIASQKVLERNGFVKTGEDKGFANERLTEIDELIYTLFA